MDDQFFVMLNWQNQKGASPMINDSEEVQFFSNRDDARAAALENVMGLNFGYEIFLRGEGQE